MKSRMTCFVIVLASAILATASVAAAPCQISGPEGLRVTLGSETGLPNSIESGGREWLSGPAQMIVHKEASNTQASPTFVSAEQKGKTPQVEARLPKLGLSLSETWSATAGGLAWDLVFKGDSPRSGHEVAIELPVLEPTTRLFTPSMYGVMDAAVYPSFTPAPYAHLGWESGQAYVLPLISILDEERDRALTIALPADANIPQLQFEWRDARVLRITLGHRGMGGGKDSALRLLFFAHPADYRSALHAYSAEFPAYFRPGLPRGPHEGAFYYHHIQAHPDFEEMVRQNIRHVWTSFWFTHLGEYLPDQPEWEPYTYAKWWKLGESMNDAKINAFIQEMHEHKIGVFAYFNVTEYGGAGGKSGDTDAAAKILKEQFGNALIRNEKGRFVPTWEGAMAMNCGRQFALWPFLEEQVKRHLQRLPGIDGFDIDRLDWASVLDYAHDDGLTMLGGKTAENLAVPVSAAVQSICAMAHAADKRVFVNQFYRIEPLRDVDGYVHENDYLPAMAYLAPYRPAAAWHMRKAYQDDLLAFEGQLKRRLQWALFPQMIAHSFPIAQQGAEPRAADLLEIYAPLFEPFLGKEQVLRPHCVRVSGPNDCNLFRNGAGHYVVPITSRVRFLTRGDGGTEEVTVRLRVPDAGELAWVHACSADRPPCRSAISAGNDEATIFLKEHGTSSVLVVGKGAETPLTPGDAERIARVREERFPGKAHPAAESLPRPALEDVESIYVRMAGRHIGQAGPLRIALNGAEAGVLQPGESRFSSGAIRQALSEALSLHLQAGDEGVWLVPERVEVLAEQNNKRLWRMAGWSPGDAADSTGTNEVTLPLRWSIPEEVIPAIVRFEGGDGRRGGRWHGKYGETGVWIPGLSTGQETKHGFAVQIQRGNPFVWAQEVQDPRVLQHPTSPEAPRTASCWFDQDTLIVHVSPARDVPYRLTFYVLDYDRNGRAVNITLSNGFKPLDSRDARVKETGRGVYLTWTVRGPVIAELRKTAGFNAVLSGVFVDAAD